MKGRLLERMRGLWINQLIIKHTFKHYLIWGNQFMGTIRHMLVVSLSLLRPPRMHLKYRKCLLLHLLIFCVLCVVYDTSLPQTSWQIFFFFWIPSNTSICILNMSRKWLPSQLLSLCLADKQGMSVYVTQTKYTSLRCHRAACVARYCRTTMWHGKLGPVKWWISLSRCWKINKYKSTKICIIYV